MLSKLFSVCIAYVLRILYRITKYIFQQSENNNCLIKRYTRRNQTESDENREIKQHFRSVLNIDQY